MMRIPRVRLTVLFMMVLVAAIAVALRGADRWSRLNQAAQARYAASLALYQVDLTRFLGGEIDVRAVYLDSRIVLEAQREMGDSTWASDHLQRMRAVQRTLARLPGNVCINDETRTHLECMVKEAEFWVLRETW
jgi:hypothetical protein